jgi:hypothetical protein
MFGIAGFAEAGGLDDLRRMARGHGLPGSRRRGFWYDPKEGIYLAHRRLPVVDLESVCAEAIECWDAGKGFDLVNRTLMFFTDAGCSGTTRPHTERLHS